MADAGTRIEVGDSLAAQFRQLQAERAVNWTPAQLEQNLAQRKALLAAFDPAASVKVGDALDGFMLRDSQGGTLTLDALVADGPAVLIFFRYADCPADNLALPYYDLQLFDALNADGILLVAISPQLPDRLDAIRVRHGLRLIIASDPDNDLAHRLGLTFTPLETPSPPPAGWIGDVTGTGTWELPQTSVLIIDRDRIVRFVAISPDWLDRVEAAEILTALRRIPAGRAAEFASTEH